MPSFHGHNTGSIQILDVYAPYQKYGRSRNFDKSDSSGDDKEDKKKKYFI
jgi:hypothetical protein